MSAYLPVPYFAFRDFPVGLEQEVKTALLAAVDGKQYILGEQVSNFEHAFANELDADFAIGVGNGLDALTIALKAAGVGKGDEVIIPANTFIATANAVMPTGATPVFAEPDISSYNLTAYSIASKITSRTKVIVPVHLYGQCCEMDAIMELATSAGINVIEDAAQAHGATFKGRKAGTFGVAGSFSFYPTKNLGALGDAGAVVTNDAATAEFIKKYRNYGELRKYQNEMIGVNSRLDTLQAAVLHVKLKHLHALNAERQRHAEIYLAELHEVGDIFLPVTATSSTHVFHIFNIRTNKRNELQQYLKEKGIITAIHYPVPVHLQPAYQSLGGRRNDFPVAEKLAVTSLSLPLFPGLTTAEQGAVITAVKDFFK